MTASPGYDYIIVGAGSAGCVLANRLTEDPAVNVVLLEAGGRDSDPLIKIPLAWAKILQERKHDWGYFTEPEPHLDGRVLECARGKVLGGCSSTNAMAYVRGEAGDFDRWARAGLTDWDFEHVLPYFKKTERWEGGGSEYRGGDGPLHTESFGYRDSINDAYMAAALAVGFTETVDYNSEIQEGFGPTQKTMRNGRRHSTADAYLRPALHRPNLTLRLNTMVTRLNMEGSRVRGVRILTGGKTADLTAAREVILSGGVINSPHLLMLSGIGPADELRKHGIEVRHDLPGVGENLQDHISAWVNYERASASPFVRQMRWDRLAIDVPRAYLFGAGPATTFPQGHMGFIRLDPANEVPDIQLLFAAGPMSAHPWFPGIRKCFENTFSCRAVVLHPASRGRLELASADPLQAVRIRPNFLSEPEDMDVLITGLEIVRRIVTRPEFDPHRGAELSPGRNVTDRDALAAYIRQTCGTVHHPLGTCRMGTDEGAVVDGELKVRDIGGIRIADASVMPDMTSGNINAPVIMIAEKAADLIKGAA